MRILFWHGYLLEGTGSNIYTRAVAREWGRAGHDVVVFCQDPAPERFDLAGAEVVRPELDTRLPTFVIDRYEGLEPVLLQDMPGDERERYVRAECCGRPRAPAGRPRLREPRRDGWAGGGSDRWPLRRQGAWLGARVLDARQCRARGAGGDLAPRRRRRLRRLRPHPRGAPRRGRTGRAGPRGAPWRGRRPVRRSSRGRTRSRGSWRSAGPTRPTRGTVRNACRTRGTQRRLREFLAGDAPTVLYFGKLLYNKGVHVLLEALRGMDVARGRRRLRRLPPRTGADGARHGRCSRARSSTATSST